MGAALLETASLLDLAEGYIAKRTTDGASHNTLRVYRYWLTHLITERNGCHKAHPGGLLR